MSRGGVSGGVVRLALALLFIATASGFARLAVDVSRQRINVRFVPDISDATRRSAEERLALGDGAEVEPGTWTYRLQDRSRRNVAALLSHPLIQDTHHIDRDRLLVTLDDPDLPAPIRSLAESGWAPWIGLVLGFCGMVALWAARGALRDGLPKAISLVRVSSARRQQQLVMIGAVMAVGLLLPLSVEERPDEALFVHLYEAPSLLAGDHPYREFFEWGAPLPALLSAAVQWASGYRVLGELLLQWAFIVTGVLVALHLGFRHTSSPLAMLAVLPAVVLLVPHSGYHFTKLFCIPVSIWLAWRYLDAPTPRRSAAMGLFTGVAFLFRHDFALWGGLAAALALSIAPLVVVAPPGPRPLVRHVGAYALAAVTVLIPWLVVVSTGEGLPSYIGAAAERFAYEGSSGHARPYAALLGTNPWPLVQAVLADVPSSRVAERWLAEVTLFVPLALGVSGMAALIRWRGTAAPARVIGAQQVVAGVTLAIVCEVLVREWSYFLIVLPLTAAFGASFLSRPRVSLALSAVILVLTTYAASLWRPPLWKESLTATVRQVRQSVAVWSIPDHHGPNRMYLYLRECTAPTDRLLATGSTPYYVPYYSHRPMAGGHVDWASSLRNDPAHEVASLALLERHSVPFVIGRGRDPLEDLRGYPRIRAYVAKHYAVVEGTEGAIMYDTRRAPVRTYGTQARPCFTAVPYRAGTR